MPGIVRGVLLEEGVIEEAPLYPEELARCRALFVTNSLIRIAAVSAVQGSGYKPVGRLLEETRERLKEIILRKALKSKIIHFPGPWRT